MSEILLHYVCPSMGAIMASVMFAAPVGDLKKALIRGSLDELNPFPWVFMTGNCLGWVAYGYYIRDPFVLAGNMPGLVISIWLNIGAIKLQYNNTLADMKSSSSGNTPVMSNTSQQHEEEKWDGDVANEEDALEDEIDLSIRTGTESSSASGHLVASPHERSFFKMIIAWVLVLVWVGWIFPPPHPEQVVGIVVNVNLVFFYGAPLQTIWTVMATKDSSSIHRPTMIMNWTNTSFWLAYALAIRNYVIAIPNFLGLLLGIAQGIVCCFYPRRNQQLEALPMEEPIITSQHHEQHEDEEDDVDEILNKGQADVRRRREGGTEQPVDWNVV